MPITDLKLRHTFVAMLFALAVAEIAKRAALLFELDGSLGWDLAAPAMQLVLALAILTASWVGWSVATDNSHKSHPVLHIFHWPFVVLLVDVFLVIVYLVIVLKTEIDIIERLILPASASEEAFWVAVMIGMYLVWDFIHDIKLCRNRPLVAMAASALALVLALVVYNLDCWRPCDTGFRVVSADVALLGVVVAFRALKGLEKWIVKRQGYDEPAPEVDRGPWLLWLVISMTVYALGVAGMLLGQ